MAAPQQGNTNLQDAAGDVLGLLPADNLPLAGSVPAVREEQSGTGVVSIVRIANVFKPINAQALTATAGNTPVSIWTPATGKKFRLLGYWLSSTNAVGLVFHDLAAQGGTGVMPVPSPIAAAAGILMSPALGLGVLSAAANNQLWLDATGATTVTGFVWGIEE